jgi:multidrug resistance efflux pump
MQRIRKRLRIDNLLSQQRSDTVRWGRRLYLALLSVLLLAVLNYLAGDAVMLRSDGIVLSERYVIAATYSAKVSTVYVREGDWVVKGALLAELESAEMLKDIADLAIRHADLATREAQLRVRSDTIDTVLPLAERHAHENVEALAMISTMSNRGLIPTNRLDQALSSSYTSMSRLAELRGQEKAIREERSRLALMSGRASEALSKLEAFYAGGLVRASATGIVGSRVPVPGQVVRFGEELMQIHGKQAYVLAYLPPYYLFSVERGDQVAISGGSRGVVGTVDAILSVAEALPPEFQNMFRPRDRSRLVRISMPAEHGFAISEKVSVTSAVWLTSAKWLTRLALGAGPSSQVRHPGA